MNDVKADPSFSYETSPDLYLFTSLTAGSSHIITATSRMETILKANRIAFKAVDCATDEQARRIWGRRAAGKKLPGLVREGMVLGDLEAVEEWNEFGEIKQMLGGAAAAPKPAAPAPAAAASTTSTAKENIKPTENGSSKPAASESDPTSTDPSCSFQEDLPVRTEAPAPTPQQLQAQLGAEAAAIAALHSKQAPKSILDRDPQRKNSRTESDQFAPAPPQEEEAAVPAESKAADAEVPAAEVPAAESAPTETSNAETSQPSVSFVEPAEKPSAESSTAETSQPSVSFVEPAEKPSTAQPDAATETASETAPPPADHTSASTDTTDAPAAAEPAPKPIPSLSTSDSAPAPTDSSVPTPPEPMPAPREPRASPNAGDLAVSSSPPSAAAAGLRASLGSSDDEAAPAFQGMGGALVGEGAGPVAAAAVPEGAVSGVGRHRGSSLSVATEDEIRDVEARNRIVEDVEGEEEAVE